MTLPATAHPASSPHSDTIFEGTELNALFDRIAQGSAERDRERILPFEQIGWLRDARFGAFRLTRATGGTGASFEQLFNSVMDLGAADSNVAHILRNHFVFVERFAQNPQNDKQQFWQEQVANGAIFGLANSEKAKALHGDVSTTRVEKTADGYRLNGTKFYSTGSLYSDFVLVRAQDDAGTQVSAIIPADREGVTLEDDWDAAGQRLTGTGTSHFKNVRVEPDEIAYDGEGTGYGRAYPSTLPQLFLTAVNAGILKAVLRDAKALLGQRTKKAFYFAASESPGEDPLLLKLIGDFSAQVFAAESVVRAAARAQDQIATTRVADGDVRAAAAEGALQAAKAKIVVDTFTLQAATSLFDIGGASSTQRSHNLDRHWRNARTISSHNPTLYKSFNIGNHELNGVPVPDKGFF